MFIEYLSIDWLPQLVQPDFYLSILKNKGNDFEVEGLVRALFELYVSQVYSLS